MAHEWLSWKNVLAWRGAISMLACLGWLKLLSLDSYIVVEQHETEQETFASSYLGKPEVSAKLAQSAR